MSSMRRAREGRPALDDRLPSDVASSRRETLPEPFARTGVSLITSPGPGTPAPGAPPSSPALRSALLALSVLALTAAFLAQHRAELGFLPATLGAFGAGVRRHGLLSLSGAGESAAGALAALAVVAGWYGLGDVLLRSISSEGKVPSGGHRGRSRALYLARTCGLGAGAWSLVWFALGLAGLYRPLIALAAAGLGLALAGRAGMASRRRHDTPPARSEAPSERPLLVRVAALLVLLPVGLAFVAALAPPTAKDALQYHLALPKAFLAAGGLVDVPDNIANYFALGAEMHGVWAMLLGRIVSARAGEAAFGAVMYAFFPLLLAAVFGWARERALGRGWAWLAAAMVAGVPTIAEVAGSGYVDLALALYVTLTIRAGVRWWQTQDPADLLESALALGCALSVKVTAAFVVFVLALIVLVRMRTAAPGEAPAHGRPLTGLATLAAAIALAAPWYLRTWVRTGSPVFPFFASFWPGQAPGWDLERSAMLVGFNALYGGADKGVLDYLLTPVRLSLAGQREVAAAYEGVLGVSFLVGAVLVVWAWARGILDVEFRIAAVSGGAFFVWWLASAQVLRYLFPALPLLAVAGAGGAAALMARGAVGPSLRLVLAACVAAGEVVMVAWFAADNPLLAATGAEPRAAYLERRLDYYPYYRLINHSLAADAKVWLVNTRRDTYHLERPYVGDYIFEDYTLRKWIESSPTGREVQRRALAAGITHVLIRHDIILFAVARSPLVDDRRPAPERLSGIERLQAFLSEGTRVLRADRKFALVELTPGPEPIPPPSPGPRGGNTPRGPA